MKWPILTLGKALSSAEIFVDGDWVESKDQDPNGNVRLVQLADVGDGQYIDKSSRFLTREKAKSLKCTFLKEGDVLLARMPDPLGRACIFPGDSKPAVTVVDVCIIRPHSETHDTRWLMHCLNAPDCRQQIEGFATGTTRTRISRGNLAKIEIPLPPLAEQKRIAGILDAADALRAKRRESLAQLDPLLQSTFLTLFGDPVSNPMGWEVAAMGDQLNVIGGFAFKSEDFADEGVPVVRISNLNRDSIDLDDCARIPRAKVGKGEKFRIHPGDTLIAMSGATTGKLGFVPDDLTDDWFLNQRVGAFRIPSDSLLQREYLRALLASPFYQQHVLNLAGGAAQPNISGKQLESAVIPLPPLPLQRRFAAIVESVERQKARQRAHLAELDALFASLQHRAFRGEL